MRHLRQCCSNDIFPPIKIRCIDENARSNSTSLSAGLSPQQSSTDHCLQVEENCEYSDPYFYSDEYNYSDDEEEETYEFEYNNIEINPTFEVASRGDPHDASLYVDSIAHILQNEEPDYVVEPKSIEKLQGPQIHERRIVLAEYLLNMAELYPSPSTEALFQCISLLDRYLASEKVPFEQLQLIACCCLWISAKVELTSEDSLAPLRKLCHEKFSKSDFIQAEAKIIIGVNYKIHTVTPYFFLKHFFKIIDADEKIRLLASYLCESTLMFVEVSCYRPSVIAFCSIAAACLACGSKDKIRFLEKFGSNFKWDDVEKCFLLIVHTGRGLAMREKSCVFRKYGNHKIDGIPKAGKDLIKSISQGSDLLQGLAELFSST